MSFSRASPLFGRSLSHPIPSVLPMRSSKRVRMKSDPMHRQAGPSNTHHLNTPSST